MDETGEFDAILNDSAVALVQHLLPGYRSARAHGCPTPDPECIPVLAPLGVGREQSTCYMSAQRPKTIRNALNLLAIVELVVCSGEGQQVQQGLFINHVLDIEVFKLE